MLSVQGNSSKGTIGVFISRELSSRCSTKRSPVRCFLSIYLTTPKMYCALPTYAIKSRYPKGRGTHQRDGIQDSGWLGARNAGPHHLPREVLAHISGSVTLLTLAVGSPHCNRRHPWNICLLPIGRSDIPQRGPLHTFCGPKGNNMRGGKNKVTPMTNERTHRRHIKSMLVPRDFDRCCHWKN